MQENLIRIGLGNSVYSRKELLNTQISLIYAREHIKNFLNLKKKEIILKNKLKEDIIIIKNKVNSILSDLHKDHEEFIKKMQIPQERKIELRPPARNLEEELLQIKQDLEKLEKHWK